MNWSIRGAAIAAACSIGLMTGAWTYAAPIQTRSNPVADGAISTTAGNNVRSDWDGVTPYTSDTNESAPADWSTVYVAHDSTNFYVRYVMNSVSNDFGWLDENQNVFIDTDLSNATGFNGAMSLGADYLLQGRTLYAYAGTGGGWGWSSIGNLVFDDFPGGDHELTLPRSTIGNPESFNFVLFGSSATEDYYPNGGNLGAVAGESFNYTTVPEPGTVALLAVASLVGYRRRR